MSDSVRPHRRQPTRLHSPWDSPSKNTGVGCHFLLPCMKVKSESEVAQVRSDPQRAHGLQPTRLLSPSDFLGKSTRVGCHCHLPEASILDSLLLLLLSRVSRVRLCATPQTSAHQAPQSLGFSRQEHWSGVPFPSPMHESEK